MIAAIVLHVLGGVIGLVAGFLTLISYDLLVCDKQHKPSRFVGRMALAVFCVSVVLHVCATLAVLP
jgi:hypothetical protein